jgi:hypothetical protein
MGLSVVFMGLVTLFHHFAQGRLGFNGRSNGRGCHVRDIGIGATAYENHQLRSFMIHVNYTDRLKIVNLAHHDTVDVFVHTPAHHHARGIVPAEDAHTSRAATHTCPHWHPQTLLVLHNHGIGTLTTANFTGSADRPVGSVVRSEPLRISLVR